MKEILPHFRKCSACGAMKDKKELLRIVKTSNGFAVDNSGKMNGRGAYVCKLSECVIKLKKVKGLDRSFKTTVPTEIYEKIINEVNGGANA
ncbi:MAG: YlxR family protein [Clostridiales bacterium]|jgi:predicted RNA-binding protein YlxR (DUF448 family)|nr:YlxR family protein [Clostridiales bacterium]